MPSNENQIATPNDRQETEERTCPLCRGRPNEEGDTEYVFAVDQHNATTTVWIGGQETEVVIDSGAGSNILTRRHWEQMKREGLKSKPHSVHKQLFPYGSSKPLPIISSFIASVKTNHSESEAEFVVVE